MKKPEPKYTVGQVVHSHGYYRIVVRVEETETGKWLYRTSPLAYPDSVTEAELDAWLED